MLNEIWSGLLVKKKKKKQEEKLKTQVGDTPMTHDIFEKS
jgi:hypothetical protein